MIEFAIGLVLLLVLYKARVAIQIWMTDKTELLEEAVIESATERQPHTYKLSTKIDELKKSQNGEWVTAEDLRTKMGI